MLELIDRAALLGVAEYPPLVALRKQMRGDSSPGVTLFSGPVPKPADVLQGQAPFVFVSKTRIDPQPDEGIAYSVDIMSVLPAKISGDLAAAFAERVLEATHRGQTVDGDSIVDRLFGAGLSAVAGKYSVTHMSVRGDREQPQVLTRIRFHVPYHTLTGFHRGKISGS